MSILYNTSSIACIDFKEQHHQQQQRNDCIYAFRKGVLSYIQEKYFDSTLKWRHIFI